MDFQTENLIKSFNEDDDETINNWDVVIAEGDGDAEEFCDHHIKYVRRGFAIKLEPRAIQVSGKNSRLGDKNYAKGGLSKEEVKEIEESARNYYQKLTKDRIVFSQDTYFSSGIKRNPLLVIYPVQLNEDKIKLSKDNSQHNDKMLKIARQIPCPVIGLSIGIPSIEGWENKSIKYKINKIEQRLIHQFFEADDDFEEEIGEPVYQ